MFRYQLLIEYEGSSFNGWQFQKKGISIQENIEIIISKLLKEKIKVHGSGRTDSGVHAIEQSAHFDCGSKIINIGKFINSMNFFLNRNKISILKLKKKNNNFHSRYSAKERTYTYIIRNDFSPSVINKNREWHIKKKINIDLMKKGAMKLVGTHDFSTFRATNCYSKSSIRTIKKIKIIKIKKNIKIKFVSQSYLRSQVRSMVGSLVYLGLEKWDLKKFIKMFKSKNRKNCAPIAPAQGLYLEKVTY